MSAARWIVCVPDTAEPEAFLVAIFISQYVDLLALTPFIAVLNIKPNVAELHRHLIFVGLFGGE
jgi:hypothetical protein